MANWYGSARSNYFHVKDVDAFKEWVDALSGCEVIADDEGRWGFLVKSEDGGLPSNRYDEKNDDDVDGRYPDGMRSRETSLHHRIRHGGLLDRRNGSDLAG